MLSGHDPCRRQLLDNVWIVLKGGGATCPPELDTLRGRRLTEPITAEELDRARTACWRAWDAVADKQLEEDRKLLLKWQGCSSGPRKAAADLYLKWLDAQPVSPQSGR
jgi:hypothetical protein